MFPNLHGLNFENESLDLQNLALDLLYCVILINMLSVLGSVCFFIFIYFIIFFYKCGLKHNHLAIIISGMGHN